MNTFGRNIRLTTFGESHGVAMGGILDGFPAGFKVDFSLVEREMERRRPGKDPLTSDRKESDQVEFLSGFDSEGISLGTPIGFMIRNRNQRPEDYKSSESIFRPNHADYTYWKRYGMQPQPGGGRSSARETVSWVAAGALLKQWLHQKGVDIRAILSSAGGIATSDPYQLLLSSIENDDIPSPSPESLEKIAEAKMRGDSVGGTVSGIITGLPAGLGNPVADKFHAHLAMAMMSINAAKGFEYGLGFESAEAEGSEVCDEMLSLSEDGKATFRTNYSGGVNGGITNGDNVYFNVAFKPTPSIALPIRSVDMEGKNVELRIKGRHDPCVALRAVPVVEAMAAIVAADFLIERHL